MTSVDGLLVVDKPAGWTSHDVVARIRRLADTRRVGHAGTLDPMATGVLLVGVGRATRLLGHLALTDKEYEATVRLGVATTTDDADGQEIERRETGQVTDAAIATAMRGLTGHIDQVPASVSAIKVDGQRAYARMRAGEAVELAARPVHVAAFELLERRGDDLDVRVSCSTGTYVRALARDLGYALHVGAHLTRLRRTRVGSFALDTASTFDELAAQLAPLSLEDAARASFARLDVDADTARRIGHGQRVELDLVDARPVAIFDPDGYLVALLQATDGTTKSLCVFRGQAD